ncbi:HNH endonuclease signature motif containing protein [Bacteroides sedimenti]|uniref:HNH endonuclease signature motif containing protein n=1 Tax=Bacteroides sedimenti TaxID=2136147 RepID=UPI003341C076
MASKQQYRKLINSKKWQKLRLFKLKNSPLCERCLLSDRTTPASEVHHITPVETGCNEIQMKQLAYDYTNLQALCRACHVAAHVELQSKSKQAAKQAAANNTNMFLEKYFS